VREVTLIPGDGIGPEVIDAARRVLDHASKEISWDVKEAGDVAYQKFGTAVPSSVIDSLKRTRLGLKGPMGVPTAGYPSPNTEIRSAMDLWCNIRMAIHFHGGISPHLGTDIVLIRDTTEDLVRGAQQMVGPDAGIAIRFITRANAERLARFGLKYAREHHIKKVTVPNQAPSFRSTDGLFVTAVLEVAKEFPELTVEEEAMDAVCMHLALKPQAYPMFLSPNLYGGILCGLCSGLAGGVGLMPGANVDGTGTAVFEAGHGSAPKYTGLNKVNPTGMILSGAMLLEHIGEVEAGSRIRGAIATVMSEGHHLTYDQGGRASTSDMADAVIAALDRAPVGRSRP
jgi:isocitrate dehydrogenase (NAD+)